MFITGRLTSTPSIFLDLQSSLSLSVSGENMNDAKNIAYEDSVGNYQNLIP